MNKHTFVDDLLRDWQLRGIVPRSGITEHGLNDFESRYSVRLPTELRAFFARADGMASGIMDPATLIRYWPLNEVMPATCVRHLSGLNYALYDGYFVFADYSLWAHGYAVRMSADSAVASPVVVVGGEAPIVVAPSFGEFITRQLVRRDMG